MVRTISLVSQHELRKSSLDSPTSVTDTPSALALHPLVANPKARSQAVTSHTLSASTLPSSISSTTQPSINPTTLPSTTTTTTTASAPGVKFVTYAPSHTRERFRDFPGVVTLHRLTILFYITSTVSLLLYLKSLLFPPLDSVSPYASAWFADPHYTLLLIVPFLHYLLSFLGAFLFRYNTRLDDVAPISQPVVWRIVSRGFNRQCLLDTIDRIREEMRRNPLFPYLIEIITDGDKFMAPDAPDVEHLRVPLGYNTLNGTKFKARALNYGCTNSRVPRSAWLVHLDEETRPTSSGIKGIASFITRCERERDYKRIGQGIILYHRSWRQHPILTLADMARTGEDVGQFYLQNVVGVPLIGLHGAFIVCRAGEEASVGFDLGPDGSITEDAWWVFLARSKGFRLGWVDGYLEEQSTESLMDFLKQRRRWMVGLLKVMRVHPTSMRHRWAFCFLMAKWICSPFLLPIQLSYVVVLIMCHIDVPLIVSIISLFNISMVFYPYLIGWSMNLREGMKVRASRVPFWTVLLVALIPIFQSLELFALVLSFFSSWSKSAQGFHVVEKSSHGDGGVRVKAKDDMV